MKRNITRILAAFALLVFMMPNLVAWGQTRDEVVAYTLQPTSGSNNSYAGNCDITINGITWNLTGNSQQIPWRIGGKNLSGVDRTLYSKTAIQDNISSIAVTHGDVTLTSVNSWTVIVASDASFNTVVSTLTPTFEKNTTTTITRPAGVDWSGCYYKFVYNVNAGNSNQYLQFSGAVFYKETGTTLQDSDLSLSPTTLSFDLYDDANAKTITISTSSTGAISVSDNAYVTTQVNGVASITVTPVAVTPEDQTITVSQAADNTYQAGQATFSVSVANSTPTYTVTYKANGGTGDDVVETYYQGEDVTVRSNTFVYTGHAFTKWNTLANGTGTDYQPAATIESIQANVELYAQWEESNEVVDVLTNSNTIGETTNNYGDWTTTGTSGAEYSGNSAGGNGTIQLRSNNNSSGIVSTTSGGLVKKVVVTWYSGTSSGRTLNVYGNNTAYTAASDLYGDNAGTLLGTIVMGTSTELTINDDYEYIGLRSASGAMYLEDIHITWEPDNNPAVVTTTTINVPSDFNTDIHQGTTAGTLTATVTAGDEAISGTTITWSSSDETVATIDDNGAVTLVAVGTTTITANYEGVEGEYRPSSGTYELIVIDSNAPGTENNPYTVAQARAAIDAGTGVTGVYATGIVSENNYFSQNNGYITYFISEDGSTESDQLEAFHGMSYNGEAFTSADDIQVGDIVVIYGNLTKYNDIYEFASGNQLVSLERPISTDPSITVEPATVTWDADFHEVCELVISYENYGEQVPSFAVMECNQSGEAEEYNWLYAYVNSDDNKVVYSVDANYDIARTGYLKVYDTELEGVEFIVTINQEAYVAPFEGGTYRLATSIESGKTYIIVGLKDGSAYAMGTQRDSNRGAVSISIDGTATTATVSPDIAAYEFVIESVGNYYSIHDARTPGYLYAASSSANQLKTEAALDDDDNGLWAISIIEEEFSVVAQGDNTRNVMRFNYNNGSPIFACYGSATQLPVALYVKEETPSDPTITVTGYGDTDGGYVLIASPTVEYADPVSIGMATGTYDLYYYDAEQDLEWRNYKAQDGGNYNLEPGKGYLYANQETVTITFTGDLNPSFSDVELPYTENDIMKSLYLAGNSSTEAQTFYVNDGNYDHQIFNYLTMNEDGDGFITTQSTSYTAPAMTGFFVQAPGEGMALSTYDINAKANVSLLNINVMRNRGRVIDNAIVSFSEGSTMNKFYLHDNTTRVYIPQGNQDFAVVRSANEGEMPVSFKASENGTYTLAVETENMEMDYLHLIDNMTGMDVDLLQTPSYTFEANSNDYTSRFRLVFSGNSANEQTAETFAYFNGTSWNVSNLGEATLQVVDVTGRLVSSETINGNATINLNETAGIYMLRLVNGNDVKVQKIVVR